MNVAAWVSIAVPRLLPRFQVAAPTLRVDQSLGFSLHRPDCFIDAPRLEARTPTSRAGVACSPGRSVVELSDGCFLNQRSIASLAATTARCRCPLILPPIEMPGAGWIAQLQR